MLEQIQKAPSSTSRPKSLFLYVAMIGIPSITWLSFLVGSGTALYYVVAIILAVFALRHLLFIEKHDFKLVLLCFIPILLSFAHVNTVDVYRESLQRTLDVILQTAAISVVLLIILATSSFKDNHFRFFLFWICLLHLPFLMMGLTMGRERKLGLNLVRG